MCLKLFRRPKDDGIPFQWGSRYIRAEELIPDVGGKYWKMNEDGSITEFRPPETRLRVAVRAATWSMNQKAYKVIERKYPDYVLIRFKTPELAKQAESELGDMFMASRSIFGKANGNLLKIECVLKGVFESRYFPGRSDEESDEKVEEIDM